MHSLVAIYFTSSVDVATTDCFFRLPSNRIPFSLELYILRWIFYHRDLQHHPRSVEASISPLPLYVILYSFLLYSFDILKYLLPYFQFSIVGFSECLPTLPVSYAIYLVWYSMLNIGKILWHFHKLFY